MQMIDKEIKGKLDKQKDGLLAVNLKSVEKELLAFESLAKRKLTQSSLRRLVELREQLHNHARAAEGSLVVWATDPDKPIETIPNKGSHQPGRSDHGVSLKAKISFVWRFEAIGQPSKNKPCWRVVVLKDSSVKVRLYLASDCNDLLSNDGSCVAAWDFDVGNDQSPGCHFHAKYHECDEVRRMAFQGVDVPRLPTFIFMPTDVIEYVVGELWQDECEKLALNSDFQEWYKFSKKRSARVLEWHRAQASEAVGSPWMVIKTTKPKCHLLLDLG